MRLLFFALIAITFASCKKDAVGKIKSGTYTGTFTRSNPLALTGSSNVTLIINEGRFSGSSDVQYYPAIGTGTITAKGSRLHVVNESFFTANFDWSYILDGEYDYEVNGDELHISKSYPNDITDSYNLTRVK